MSIRLSVTLAREKYPNTSAGDCRGTRGSPTRSCRASGVRADQEAAERGCGEQLTRRLVQARGFSASSSGMVTLVLQPFLGSLRSFSPQTRSLLQSSVGKALAHATVQALLGFVAFLPPLLPSAPSSSDGRGCRLSSGRTLRVRMPSLGRAVTSPAASRSQTRRGRQEKPERRRGPQAFHSSHGINLIYRHNKMQLKRELK